MMDADHITDFLGDRIIRMEAFAQSWDDPNNKVYKSVTEPIAPQTYIFRSALSSSDC